LGAKRTLPQRLNERRIIAPTALIAEASDRLIKQTFELRRKSGWSVNPHEKVANLGEQFANFVTCRICHAPTNARFVAKVDMQLLSSYF
jgi:hypothetical protein